MPDISVIICTHNRLRYLDGSFGSLLAQSLPSGQFEVILVDNGSTDGTRAWADGAKERAADAGLNFIYIYESALGLSVARNAGWRAADSEIIAFLDDDAVAQSDWLKQILEKFQGNDKRLAVVGGKVDTLWEVPPPEWLVPALWPVLSVLDWSPTQFVMGEQHYFAGANMAIRKHALEEVGGFSCRLGRKGGILLSNEEILLKLRLEAAGYHAVYAPDVVVRHAVPRERMSREWLRRRYYWQGVSDALLRESLSAGKCEVAGWCRRCARAVRGTAQFGRAWFGGLLRGEHRNRGDAAEFAESRRWGNVVGAWRALMT